VSGDWTTPDRIALAQPLKDDGIRVGWLIDHWRPH